MMDIAARSLKVKRTVITLSLIHILSFRCWAVREYLPDCHKPL